MIDFLRANPFITREEYLWEWTVPQVKLANYDYSHSIYLSEEQELKRKAIKCDGQDVLKNDLGIPILNNNKKI